MDTRVTDGPSGAIDRSSRVHRLPDGRRIGYAEYGAPGGLPAIALHGTPGCRYMFALTDAAARARNLRIIAPERPGYGLSDTHRFDTLEETAHDVEAIADALGMERFVLIGVSGGGPYVVAAAARLKGRILRMALIAPVGPITVTDHVRMSHIHHFIFTYLARSPHAAGAFFLGLRTMIDWTPAVAYHLLMQRVTQADNALLHRPDVRENLQAIIREGLRPGIEGPLQDLRLYCGPWNLPLGEIGVSALMWQGSADTIVPPDAAYHLARALPDCRLDVIEGAGHYWIFGGMERVLDAVRATWS